MVHRPFYLMIVFALALVGGLLPIGTPAAAQEPTANYRVYLPLLRGTPPSAPAIDRFTGPTAAIAPGGTATLNWSVRGATSVRIEPGVGDVTGRTSAAVQPAVTTTYTLIATNAAGERRAAVTVTVANQGGAPPAGSFFLPDEAPTRNFAAAYDAAGVMHVAYVRHTRTENVQEVVYGQCPAGANCDRVANWRTLVIHSGNIGSVQLAVTANGRPRLAIQDEYTVVNVRLAYMACEANCLTNAGWEGIALGQGLSFGGAFLQHTDQRWFAIDRTGLPHMLVATQEGSYYITCRQACATDGEGWSLTSLDTTGDPFLTSQLFNPVLRVGADGRVHVLGQNSRPELVYLTCGADCAQAESWQRLVLADYNQPGISDQIPMAVYPANLDLELDRAGRVVVGFGGFTPGQNAPLRSYLLRCAADCAEAANWSGRPFADNGANGLDLVLDPNDRPLWLLIGKRATDEERLAELATCTAGDCFSPSSRWSARIISSSNEMEAERPIKTPAATPPVCSIPTTSWEHGANQVLFTPAGQMRLLTSAVGTSICQPGMDEWIDQWGTKKRGRTIDVWVFTARARWTIVP